MENHDGGKITQHQVELSYCQILEIQSVKVMLSSRFWNHHSDLNCSSICHPLIDEDYYGRLVVEVDTVVLVLVHTDSAKSCPMFDQEPFHPFLPVH